MAGEDVDHMAPHLYLPDLSLNLFLTAPDSVSMTRAFLVLSPMAMLRVPAMNLRQLTRPGLPNFQ